MIIYYDKQIQELLISDKDDEDIILVVRKSSFKAILRVLNDPFITGEVTVPTIVKETHGFEPDEQWEYQFVDHITFVKHQDGIDIKLCDRKELAVDTFTIPDSKNITANF